MKFKGNGFSETTNLRIYITSARCRAIESRHLEPKRMNVKHDGIRRRYERHGPSKEQEENEDSEIDQNPCLERTMNKISFDSIIQWLYRPACPKSLCFVRALFGLMMIIDVPDERGLADIDIKYGDPMKCHFPLFDWLTPLQLEYMGLLYFIMWLGAAGICLGYKFRLSCLMFTLPYWYILLLDKTVWNNHSYLFGLLSFLFMFSSANHSYSIDAFLNPNIKHASVPLWNYVIIRFQLFLLYFYAGIKKFDLDWIGGHSMSSLSKHWVFDPFKYIFDNEQIDLWLIHIFGFFFDLTVGFFLLIKKTRPFAIFISSAFHLMNSCIFHIGQFPYVCLVTTPIFCSYDWPDQIFLEKSALKGVSGKDSSLQKTVDKPSDMKITWRHRLVTTLLVTYTGGQLFLPYSHFITQGYNNWTNGLYGYSWDMMVHTWDTVLVVVKAVDNDSKQEFFLDPEAWVENTRYSKHGDMLIQYAKCLERNLKVPAKNNSPGKPLPDFKDTSIYIDVWCSLNGRFQQRMFDPRQDLLKAEWSPFQKTSWLMPLLSELTSWRTKMVELQTDILGWSNYSDVLFAADFPGLYLENYISMDLTNVSVTVLRGTVVLEQKNSSKGLNILSNVTLFEGDSINVVVGEFHKIYTVSSQPSCYMYTYVNSTLQFLREKNRGHESVMSTLKDNETIMESLKFRLENFIDSVLILRACFYKLLYDIPIPRR